MGIIVQKFGGTSVVTQEARRRVADHVASAVNSGKQCVVVVSAMGRAGDPYATDTLINLARQVYEDTSAREMDLLISCGEIISSVIVANTLKAHGIDSMVLSGGQAGIITDSNFGNAQIIRVEPDHLLRHLSEGKVVVVAGFQGVTESGDITTLGRGGSDTTAAALGVALGAEVVEIYTDVDGVKTADPRLVPDASTIDRMSYEEICQMAHEGARVIHPRAVEIAMRRNVPLRVKCTFKESPGTLITYSFEAGRPWPSVRNGRPVTAVTHIPNLARVKLLTSEIPQELEFELFRSLADVGISVDMINVSPEAIAFVVSESVADRAERTIRALGLEVSICRGCAKVSIVGSGMRGLPGVMARLLQAMKDAGIRVLQTADSHVTISCLVKIENLELAVRALHSAFGLDNKSPLAEEKKGE